VPIIPILLVGALVLLVFGYWFSFLNGSEGRRARKEMASGEGWIFVYLAWGFLIFGIAWLIGNLRN
jgi:vacuolar-type H+-ATPase subunit I/STV1